MRTWDCCMNDWKEKIKSAYNLASEGIRSIVFNGKTYTPDGTGKVDITNPTASDISTTDGNVQTDIEALKNGVNGLGNTVAAVETSVDKSLNEIDISIAGDTTGNISSAWIRAVTNNGDAVNSSRYLYPGTGIGFENKTGDYSSLGLTVNVDDAPASEVNLTDGRDIQTAIDAIEDEIGDEDTAGSIIYNNAQAFKQFLISTETDGDTNQTTITLEQYRTTDFTDTPTTGNIVTVGDGLAIDNSTGKKIVSNAGVTSIIAGDNITVDNSTGAVTISAAASGATLKILNLAQNVSYSGNDQATSTVITNATVTHCYPASEAISLHTSGNWYIFNFAEITSTDFTFDNMYLVADSLSNLTNLAAYCPHIPDNISFEGNLILDGCYFYKNGVFTQATDQPVLFTKSNGVVTIAFNSTDDDVPIYYTATGIISMGFLFSNVYSVYDA